MALLKFAGSVIFVFVLYFDCIDGGGAGAPKRRTFGQLPTSLSPTKYQVSIQPYFPADGVTYPSERNFTFDANLTISISCLDDTDNITIHMLEIKLNQKNVRLVDAETKEPIALSEYVYDNVTQQAVFPANSALKAGRTYEMHLTYQGAMDGNALAGLYPSNYKENGRTKYVIGVTRNLRSQKSVWHFQMAGSDAIRANRCQTCHSVV